MAIGPGKYDAECTELRKRLEAEGGILIAVFNGAKGDGFSAQLTPRYAAALPRMLRQMADEIERSDAPG